MKLIVVITIGCILGNIFTNIVDKIEEYANR